MTRPGVVRRLVDWTASIKAGPGSLLALFIATVVARNLMESAPAGMVFPPAAFLLHFPIAYIFPMTGLVWMMHLLSGYDLGRLLKLMVFAWTLTLLPPVIDLIAGTASPIGYFPLDRTNAAHFLLNFFNPAVELPGTTTGIRVEAMVGCILAGVFSWAVADRRRLFRGVMTTLVFAPVFLVFFTWPNLVYIALSGLFPEGATTQEFYQWHAATYPHLSGSFHYTIFLVDLMPVTVLLAWFLRKLAPRDWKNLLTGLRSSWWMILAPIAGTAAAITASSGGLTFADTVSLIGTGLAGILVAIAYRADGWVRWSIWTVAGAAAASVGWETLTLVIAAAALSSVPGPAFASRGLTGGALFLAASSPIGLSWVAIAAVPLILGAVSSAFSGRRAGILTGTAAMLAAALLPIMSPTAWTDYHTGLTDTFNRNGRQDMALPTAVTAAGSGGSMLTLARAELSSGDIQRARWAYEVAVARGDSGIESLRTGMNLAFAQGRREELDLLLHRLSDHPGEASTDLSGLLLSRAAGSGDTLLIRTLMDTYGTSPHLLNAYSMACAFQGDVGRAAPYARAAASHPEARAAHIAWAIQLTAGDGGDFDSLYEEGIRRFPGSVEIMTARTMAPISAGMGPDRPDLVETCLALRPVSPGVLRSAAAWFLESGDYASALETAERAIAVSRDPDPVMLELAATAAAVLGDSARAAAHSSYLELIFPESPRTLPDQEEPRGD